MRQVLYHPESDDLFVGEFDQSAAEAGAYPIDPTRLPAGARIRTALGHSDVLPSMDFETYSEAGFVMIPQAPSTSGKFVPALKVKGVGSQGKGGLPVVGTPVYAEHPSTEILSLSYNLKDGKGKRRWVPGMPPPADLIDHIQSGGLIEAWNVTFEFWIWNMVAARRLGWPPLPLEQCRCAMAKSRRHSLPGGLDNAAKVLGTPQKDPDGKRLLQKLTRPHTPTKARPAPRWLPATAPEDFAALYDYNDGDVDAEDCASAMIPDLTPVELATWQMDQTINARGVQVDTETLDAALVVLEQAERKYTMELARITAGAVGSVSEVAKFGDWLAAQGYPLPDMTADTVRDALKRDDLPRHVRGALEIRDSLGAANVKKLRSLRLQVSSDGRLRDQYKYCGADRTGRAAAQGVQLQNITAKGPKVSFCDSCERPFGKLAGECCPRCGAWTVHDTPEWEIRDVRQAVEDVRTRDLDHVERIWGAPIAVLCGILRGLFIAAPGKKLVCVDFSAIEAVAAACLSRCQWRIEVFNTPGECIYTRSASQITGTPVEEYKRYKAEQGGHHPDRKKIGKIAELACFGPHTQVLTRRGYVSIEAVRPTDKLWDGVEWVSHEGAINKGRRETLVLDGVRVTPDHPVSLKSSWTEAKQLALNPSLLRRALATGSENLPSLSRQGARESAGLLSGAAAAVIRTFVPYLTSTRAKRRDALSAAGRKAEAPTSKNTASTPTSSRTRSTAGDWLTGFARLLRGATRRTANSSLTTAGEEYPCTTSGGALTGRQHSSGTLSRSTGGTGPSWRWTVLTSTGTTSRGIFGLLRAAQTWLTSGRSGRCRPVSTNWSDVYDIVNAGPRNRFTIRTDSGHLIVHNSGYGGWINAWKAFGATDEDSKIKADVLAWREESPEIVHMWGGQFVWCGPGKWDYRPELHGLEGMAILAIQNPGQCFSYNDITYGVQDDILFCRLPSGRFLHYHKPRLTPAVDKLNRGPSVSISFEGWNSNSQKGPVGWVRMETFGGRLFENVVQAVSADLQFGALLRCEAAGYPIVMHTHDEGCAEVPDSPEFNVDAMTAIMVERPAWASWWPLNGAGWEDDRYQKD